ncbi:MAG: UDP-N-acetylglucosamine 1-carboxyvinyltransferase [Anaerofustis stercorihominis]|nr:UDP-N-acetylglucosamine 1-carboxyvinyltransferase [Anaerofustis stercorihominis]
MQKILIKGGTPLRGEVSITGAKNAALGILPATLLCRGECVLENVPHISDTKHYETMLTKLGSVITHNADGTMSVDTKDVSADNIYKIEEESTLMRASYYMIGALLGLFNDVKIPLPGGCDIGARPIDQHIKGFLALGATVDLRDGYIHAYTDKLVGSRVYFDVVSVGATINVMLAAVFAEGITTLENVAKEPHVVDVANFLNKAGAKIVGAGTDVIKITGVKKLNPVSYCVVADQITAGTYMIAAAATEGDVLIKNIIPEHLDSISAKIKEMGAEIIEFDDALRVIGHRPFNPTKLKTLPHPGFPTDLQQPMGVLMSIARGSSSITETIFENRFKYTDELRKMGANIIVAGNTAVFTGVEKLTACPIKATDLRAGAAMIIAALVADGTSEITGLEHIDRGYDNIVNNLKALGADIERIDD